MIDEQLHHRDQIGIAYQMMRKALDILLANRIRGPIVLLRKAMKITAKLYEDAR